MHRSHTTATVTRHHYILCTGGGCRARWLHPCAQRPPPTPPGCFPLHTHIPPVRTYPPGPASVGCRLSRTRSAPRDSRPHSPPGGPAHRSHSATRQPIRAQAHDVAVRIIGILPLVHGQPRRSAQLLAHQSPLWVIRAPLLQAVPVMAVGYPVIRTVAQTAHNLLLCAVDPCAYPCHPAQRIPPVGHRSPGDQGLADYPVSGTYVTPNSTLRTSTAFPNAS